MWIRVPYPNKRGMWYVNMSQVIVVASDDWARNELHLITSTDTYLVEDEEECQRVMAWLAAGREDD